MFALKKKNGSGIKEIKHKYTIISRPFPPFTPPSQLSLYYDYIMQNSIVLSFKTILCSIFKR